METVLLKNKMEKTAYYDSVLNVILACPQNKNLAETAMNAKKLLEAFSSNRQLSFGTDGYYLVHKPKKQLDAFCLGNGLKKPTEIMLDLAIGICFEYLAAQDESMQMLCSYPNRANAFLNTVIFLHKLPAEKHDNRFDGICDYFFKAGAAYFQEAKLEPAAGHEPELSEGLRVAEPEEEL